MKKVLFKSKHYVRPVIYIETEEREETEDEIRDFFGETKEES